MSRRHIVLLIAIRLSDGDVKPGGPVGAFLEEQAMTRHRVSPSPFLSLSPSSHTTQIHYTNSYTYSHPNLNFVQYTIQLLVPHVMWSAQAVRDSKIETHSTSSISFARNPKRVIVQWAGTGKHTHTHTQTHRHTRTHAHIHTHTDTHPPTHPHTQKHTHTHTYTHSHAHARMHTQTHTHARLHARAHTHKHSHTQTHTHTNTNTNTNAHTHTHKNTHTHVRMHACAHIQTHSHAHNHDITNFMNLTTFTLYKILKACIISVNIQIRERRRA